MLIFLLLLSLIALILLFVFKKIRAPKFYSPLKNLTPKNTIITFDLHGVLFKKDIKKIIWLFLSNKNTLRLIINLFHPRVMYDLITFWIQGSPVERYIMHLTATYPYLAPCKQLLIDVSNAQRPIAKNHILVQELKQLNYTVGIFSNIGEIILQDLQKKHPKVFSSFDHIFTTSNALKYISKKDDIFYVLYEKKYANPHKTIVFIDDSVKNITWAWQRSWTSILYINPTALRLALQGLKLIPKGQL